MMKEVEDGVLSYKMEVQGYGRSGVWIFGS